MTLDSYNTLFIVCLVITIILYILLIILFFAFDIRKIVNIKTGRAVRQSVKELNEVNRVGDNKQRKKYKGRSVSFSKIQQNGILENERNIEQQSNIVSDSNRLTEAATVTEELEQEQTTLLEDNTEGDILKEAPILEKELKDDEIFNIFESKTIIFSSEIIKE